MNFKRIVATTYRNTKEPTNMIDCFVGVDNSRHSFKGEREVGGFDVISGDEWFSIRWNYAFVEKKAFVVLNQRAFFPPKH